MVLDASRAVNPSQEAKVVDELRTAGVHVDSSDEAIARARQVVEEEAVSCPLGAPSPAASATLAAAQPMAEVAPAEGACFAGRAQPPIECRRGETVCNAEL